MPKYQKSSSSSSYSSHSETSTKDSNDASGPSNQYSSDSVSESSADSEDGASSENSDSESMSFTTNKYVYPYTVPTKDRWLIKSIRNDENSYYRQMFLFSVTRSAEQQKKFIYRTEAKTYTVYAEGVYQRPNKPDRYKIDPEHALGFSAAQSCSLVTKETIHPPVFGHSTDRKDKLVGIITNLRDAIPGRLYIYDTGTKFRPYDKDSRFAAQAYHERVTDPKHPILFSDFESFESAISNDSKSNTYNEVLARLRWGPQSKIGVFSDTLEARLLAQDYARLMRTHLFAQHLENGLPWDASYVVPISFYIPETDKILVPYTREEQELDRRLAISIYRDPIQFAQKCDADNYEFLLALSLPPHHIEDEYDYSSDPHSSSEIIHAKVSVPHEEKKKVTLCEMLLTKKKFHILESLLENDSELRANDIPQSKTWHLYLEEAISKEYPLILNFLLKKTNNQLTNHIVELGLNSKNTIIKNQILADSHIVQFFIAILQTPESINTVKLLSNNMHNIDIQLIYQKIQKENITTANKSDAESDKIRSLQKCDPIRFELEQLHKNLNKGFFYKKKNKLLNAAIKSLLDLIITNEGKDLSEHKLALNSSMLRPIFTRMLDTPRLQPLLENSNISSFKDELIQAESQRLLDIKHAMRDKSKKLHRACYQGESKLNKIYQSGSSLKSYLRLISKIKEFDSFKFFYEEMSNLATNLSSKMHNMPTSLPKPIYSKNMVKHMKTIFPAVDVTEETAEQAVNEFKNIIEKEIDLKEMQYQKLLKEREAESSDSSKSSRSSKR